MKRRKWFYSIMACCLTMLITFATSLAEDSAKRIQPEQEKALTLKEAKGSQEKVFVSEDLDAKVKEILSKYSVDTLTQDDAVAINNAFREAGIRRGSSQRQAIIAAGFDPQAISSLDPPPDRKKDGPWKVKQKSE